MVTDCIRGAAACLSGPFVADGTAVVPVHVPGAAFVAVPHV